MGALLVIGGRLGDRFGQRRLFVVGMTGFSPDAALLIVARIVQGAFGALLLPQGVSIMTKAFDTDMLAKAFGPENAYEMRVRRAVPDTARSCRTITARRLPVGASQALLLTRRPRLRRRRR